MLIKDTVKINIPGIIRFLYALLWVESLCEFGFIANTIVTINNTHLVNII